MAGKVGEEEQSVEQRAAVENPNPPLIAVGHSFGMTQSCGYIKVGLSVISIIIVMTFASLCIHFFEEKGAQMNLKSYGAEILSIRRTTPIQRHLIMGLPSGNCLNPPETLLKFEPPVPGKCWAFKGDRGNIIMTLIQPSVVHGVYLEHISKKLSPYGHISSAPKLFRVYGMNEYDFWMSFRDVFGMCVKERVLLGEFTFDGNGPPKQYFSIVSDSVWGVIELEVLSNQGAVFTCLYRFRVIGELGPDSEDEVKTPSFWENYFEVWILTLYLVPTISLLFI